MAKPYRLAVFIGRFQPFHKGHLAVVRQALESADHILILVGSANLGQTPRNPFPTQMRIQWIREGILYDGIHSNRTSIAPIYDHPYDYDAWRLGVRGAVHQCLSGIDRFNLAPDDEIALIGHPRDHTSFYLEGFPSWSRIDASEYADSVSATAIRKTLFEDQNIDGVLSNIPSGIERKIWEFRFTKEFERLRAEHQAEVEYRARWGLGPHLTADAVVTYGDNILLVERKNLPGKGLLALPGGHLNPFERFEDCALRELQEETQIIGDRGSKTNLSSLKDSLLLRRVFDDPNRSGRARVITEAFLFALPETRMSPPEVVGSDDAARAFWLPFRDLRPDNMFDDHYFIIEHMLKSGSIVSL